MDLFKQYLLNVALSLDQLVNTLLGGNPDETLSQRLGRSVVSGNRGCAFYFARGIDFLFYLLLGQKNHCVGSLDGKPNVKEIWDWGK